MGAYDVWWKFSVEATNDMEAERIARKILCNPRFRYAGNVVPQGSPAPLPPSSTEIEHPAPARLAKPTPGMVKGTSREALMYLYGKAYWAVNGAVNEVEKCKPLLQDYYVQGPPLHFEAEQQHNARIKLLETVRRELAQIWMSLHDTSN